LGSRNVPPGYRSIAMTVSIANVSIAQRVNRKAVAIMSRDIRIAILRRANHGSSGLTYSVLSLANAWKQRSVDKIPCAALEIKRVGLNRVAQRYYRDCNQKG